MCLTGEGGGVEFVVDLGGQLGNLWTEDFLWRDGGCPLCCDLLLLLTQSAFNVREFTFFVSHQRLDGSAINLLDIHAVFVVPGSETFLY